MNPSKVISEEDENVLINYILYDDRLTTTRNAAIVLKELTFYMLLGDDNDYFTYLREGFPDDFYEKSEINKWRDRSTENHFKGIDKLVENHYETFRNEARIWDLDDKWMDEPQLKELIRKFKPLLFRYKKIYETNQNYFLRKTEFLPMNDPVRFIAVYAFTKIVHFNVDSVDLNSFFKRLPYDRYIILRMGKSGILKVSYKNLSIGENIFNLNVPIRRNIMSVLDAIQKKEFPDNLHGKTVALIGAPGYTDDEDIPRVYTESSSWRLSEVLRVLRNREGFEDFFSIKKEMKKTEYPGELKGRTFSVRIDGEPHIFDII
jgi:hypothetical protein